MSYTLHFSDLTTTTNITVLSKAEGTGINNYDTSLELVGAGYPNYGRPTAQNFLKLLENFAAPSKPLHPIKGQLWYDTSNAQTPLLKIYDGKSDTWPNATGVYQQSSDPVGDGLTTNIINGNIWVDTNHNQLKIRNAGTWTIVGPNILTGANKTGIEATTATSTTGVAYPIMKNWVNGYVVEIISYDEFTPRTVIDGFSSIKRGTNLTNKVVTKYNGLAEKASALEVTPGVLVNAIDVITTTDVSTDISPNLIKTGMIIGYGNSSSIPSGYLVCDNSSVSTTSYSDLYNVIGETYGTNGEGTFRTPNMTTSTKITSNTYLTYIIKT
jgi:hypothetical protein